jgi:hypothetical protein
MWLCIFRPIRYPVYHVMENEPLTNISGTRVGRGGVGVYKKLKLHHCVFSSVFLTPFSCASCSSGSRINSRVILASSRIRFSRHPFTSRAFDMNSAPDWRAKYGDGRTYGSNTTVTGGTPE